MDDPFSTYLEHDRGGGDGVDVYASPEPDCVVRPVRRPPHELGRLVQVGHVRAPALDLEMAGKISNLGLCYILLHQLVKS